VLGGGSVAGADREPSLAFSMLEEIGRVAASSSSPASLVRIPTALEAAPGTDAAYALLTAASARPDDCGRRSVEPSPEEGSAGARGLGPLAAPS
jgi:hypothetical protein